MLRRRRQRLAAAALPALVLLVAADAGTVRAATNRPPVTAGDRVTIDRGQSFSVNVLRNDSDPEGDRLHVVKVTARNDRSRLEWEADGTISGKPIINEGFAFFTYTVADDDGATTEGDLTVALAEVDTPGNDRPLARTERVRAYEGRPVTVRVLDNDGDVDGDPLSVSVFDCCHPTYGTGAVVNPDQSITLTPHSITASGVGYRVSDGTLTADTYVTVEQMPLNPPGNDAPRPGPDLVFARPGETKLLHLLDNDQDIDGDPLTLTRVGIGSAGSATIEPDGRTARVTVDPVARGMHEISYTTSDGRGGTADGYYSHLFVFEADNPAPEQPIGNADRAVTTEGKAVTVSPLANDVDRDGDTLRLLGVAPVAPPGFGTATANSDGTVTFTPAPGKTGQAVVPYTMTDGTPAMTTSEIRIDVAPQSGSAAGPVMGRDQAVVPAFGTVTIPVLDNDYDPAGGNLRITKLYDGVQGTASLSSDGRSVIYRNKDVLPAFDTLVYYVTDSAGRTAYQSVDITLALRDTPGNQAPMAYGDYPETERGRAMTVQVLANDPDLEGAPLRVTRLTKPVQHGTAVITSDGQAVRYTPDPDFEGTEYVEYEMTDGTTRSRADLWLRVIGSMTGGDLAEDDLGITLQDEPVTIAVTQNDRNPVTMPTFGRLLSQPAHGRAEAAPGGTVRYTPDPSWYGVDTFTYATAAGAQAEATVHVVAVRGGTTPSPPVPPSGGGGSGTGDPGTGSGGPGSGGTGGGSDGGSGGSGGDAGAGGSGPNVVPSSSGTNGYWMLDASGRVYSFGDAGAHGAPAFGSVPAVDLEPTPSGHGYWVLDRPGRVHAFGDAARLGDVAPSVLADGETASSLSATPTGRGYWVFTNRGRAVPFGDAAALGDMSATRLNGPVLDSVATPSGRGYYMVASDGGIFAFGDARFAGSMGGRRLNAPVQSLVPDADGSGYWLVASDGGIFAFGAPFKGSMGGHRLNKPVTGMVTYADGYLMVGEDGGIFNFSSRPFSGSLGDRPPSQPVVAVAALR